MRLKIKFNKFVALFIIILCILGESNEQKWANKHLIKYIKKDLKVSQTVLIVSEDAVIQDQRVSNNVEYILQEIPCRIIRLNQSHTPEAQVILRTLMHQSFVSTTLFILIPFLKENIQVQTTVTTDFLNQLSTSKPRPKCLMLALPKKGKLSYRKLLQNMWSYFYLDV